MSFGQAGQTPASCHQSESSSSRTMPGARLEPPQGGSHRAGGLSFSSASVPSGRVVMGDSDPPCIAQSTRSHCRWPPGPPAVPVTDLVAKAQASKRGRREQGRVTGGEAGRGLRSGLGGVVTRPWVPGLEVPRESLGHCLSEGLSRGTSSRPLGPLAPGPPSVGQA